MASNPFALLTEPSTAFAPPEQDKAPANPFEGLAAYSTAPDKVPRGTKIPGSVAGTEPIRWITIGGHPVPIKAPSGADHMLPVPGNTNVLQDPQTKEHYFKTPGPDGQFKSIWDTQRKVAKDGNIVSHVKGVGDKVWGEDPKVAERAQKKQETADKKEQKDATTAAAGDTKEVLQQAAIPVTVAKETLAHQDKLFSAQVTKAQTNKKLSAGVVNSTQDKANEVYSALKTHVETNHDPAAGKYQGNDEDFVPRFKKLKLPEGTSEDQYKSKEAELRKQYRDAQATANAAKRVDDENKRFVATAYFHKQAWLDQSKPLREGLKQTTVGLKSFKDQKLLTESPASRLQANEEQVRTSWPLKTNTGRNADSSARPPQITTPPDFNQYNPEAPQPTPAQTQAAGRDVIAEHMDISGLPPMPRVGIQPRTLGSSFMPLNGPKLATPTRAGEVPDLTGEQDDSLKEARASTLVGLQNANRGMAYNVPDKPITWDKDTLHHDGQPVGKIQRDEFGAPALYIDHGHDGQKVSPSLNSGHYYDGIPELSSPSPAHLDEFKANGVTKPEDVQKAWGQRRWSTSDLNDLVDQWTSSNDDERQDLIAQTTPSQANVAKGQRRLNTRELYKEGMISAQDARMLDHAFYGRKPGVEDPGQSFEQFKQSAHPDARAFQKYATDDSPEGKLRSLPTGGTGTQPYGIMGVVSKAAAHERMVGAWAKDYLDRNRNSPDFDQKSFIAARDKLLLPLGDRAVAKTVEMAQGLVGFTMSMAGQLSDEILGLAKAGGGLGLRKLSVDPKAVKEVLDMYGADQAGAVVDKFGIHPHDENERQLISEGTWQFTKKYAMMIADHTTPGHIWSGKNQAVLKDTTKELFDLVDSESVTPEKFKQLASKLQTAAVGLKGLSNFDPTNKEGFDYNGRYDASDPRSPLAQALAAYSETLDPSYKELFAESLRTSEGADALKAKMQDYLQAHGHIQGSPLGSIMQWVDRATGGALQYDNPDAWKTLSESAGNTVQPLQIMAISELMGAASVMPGLLKGAFAPTIKSTGRALMFSSKLANGAEALPKVLGRITTIPLDTAVQSAGRTFASQLGKSAMHGAGFMAIQQPGMNAGQSLGDVFKAGAEGAAIGMAAGSFNAAAKALDIRRTNAAQNKAHEDFVGHWNESFPHNPITIADSRQASHYMGPEEAPRLQQIRTLADQFAAIKDKVSKRTATREEFEQLKPLRLQLDNLFVAQQHAMDGAVAATQEINGITDPNLKGWANAALKQLSGNPLTPVEEAAMTSAVTENGLPLSTPNGDGTHTITDAGLATMEQVAPATRRAYFPSDETSQFTTPNEQPASAQPPTTETAPTPGDPSQEVPLQTGGDGEEIKGGPKIEQTLERGDGGDQRTDSPVGQQPTGEISEADRMGVGKLAETPPELVRPAGEQGVPELVEAPPETVNPAPSSPEPAPQADPARAESDTEPAKAITPEEVKTSTKAVKLPVNQHLGKAVAAVATALGEKIVDTGIPSGFTSFGKHINWGTQIYDKVVPGGPVGQWMDGLAKANPQVHEYLQHTHTAPWLHRMWFGHDWLMNWHKIVDQFGAGALPTYFKELFKDNLTKQGLPLPGAQWIWEKGLVDRTEGNADWMSMNIGEEMSAGIAITGTAMLFKKLVKGEQIHDGWALTGMLVKAGTGVVQHNPILILTSAADAAIIAAANTKSIAKAFRLRAERRAALDKAIEPSEKKFSNFKAPEIDPSLRAEPETENTPAPVPEGKEVGTPDYRSIARQQIEDQLKDSPALQDLIKLHENVSEDMKLQGGMAVGRDLSIHVSLPELEDQLRGMTPEEAKTHVAKVLDEEVRHIADTYAANRVFNQQVKDGKIPADTNWKKWTDDYYGKIWDSLNPEQQKAVLDSYDGLKLAEGLDSRDVTGKAMEALRMISQHRAMGDQSETSMLWSDLPQVLLDHLKAVFDYLKELSKKKLPPILEEQLRGIEQVLKEHNYGQKEKASEQPKAGWKLHLATSDPEAVSTILKENGLKHKVGNNGEQAGKDITVYSTNRDQAQKDAELINTKAGHLLDAPHGDALEHDTPISGRVVGRFDVTDKTQEKYHQYGSNGVPHLNEDVHGALWGEGHDSSEMESKAHAELTKDFGEYYTGTGIDAKAHEAATSPHNDLPEPTPAQAFAENYRVGKVKVAGLSISIENPHGSVRRGVSPEGKPWETEMQDHYGRIKGSLSVDGDHLDVFVKPGTPEDFNGNVFVVHQMDPKTGKLDEYKSLIGYSSIDEAKAAYQANYSKGWKGMGDVVEMSLPEFKAEMQRMTEVQKHPAMVELRKSNEELPAAAQKLWTPEVYAKAADFYKTGEVKALDGLTVIQKRRITAAGVKSSPEALAREAAAEKAMRQKEAEDVKHMRATTEKFLQSAPVKPEQDAAYTDAVKRGDTETAQKLVDEAAKAAFPKSSVIEPMQSSKQKLADMPLLRVYHGTNAEITKFESGRKTTDDYGWLGPVDTHRHAIFFAENRDFAQTFAETRKGKNIVSAYLNIENPFLFSDVPDLLDVTRTAMDNGEESANGDWQMLTYLRSLRDHWEAFDDKNGEEFAQWLKAKGYDGVQFQEEGHGLPDTPTQDVWAALDPNQIKSADPITKDANGEVIPLSQRFNPQSDDIRYSAPIKRTPEEIAEMMKGLPAEERAKIALDNNLTAPKNAVTEEMQSRLNMPATQKIAALKETEVDALARRKLATNPDAPRAILNDFNQSGKAMSATDVRVLGKESGRIYSRLKEIEDLRGKASPEERAAMAAESRELRPYLDELYQAISHTGTLSSDALRSRKYLEELNHSEAGIKQALRNAFGGRDLTPEEEATVSKEAEEISKAYIAVERQKVIEDAPKVSAALQRAVTDASQPITAPTQRTVSGAALKQVKSRAAKARELLAKSAMEPAQSAPLKSAPIKLSAEKLAAYADIAAEHLLEGRNISDELVKEYPDSRAHLSEIITEAKKVHAAILAEVAKAEQAKAAKAAAKLDPRNIMTAARAGEYGDEISPQWMHELAMAHIVDAHKDGGTPTETDIIKRMVKDVKTLFPDAGEREVREALVDYGKISAPNPEQMATELRQLKRISRLVLSKEDATEGKAPPKSQIRDKQSPEERQMRRELARIMDEHNVERQDPERALASRRDRLKSSLNNQIEDLQRIIDAKAKPERKLNPLADDAEIRQLKARKQALVDQVNAMDSVKAATEAQRVETAIKAAKVSQMEWERKLRDQEILAKKAKTPEANAAVVEARKQRDAAREAYNDMVDAKDMHLPGALFKEAERKLEAAKKREAEIRDKIIKGDLSSTEVTKPSFTTPELEAQKGVNAELNKQLAKMRSEVAKAQRVADKARQANLPGDLFKRAETTLKAALKREVDLQDKITKGDLKVKQIVGQFKTPELEQAQARVKTLNEQMAKLRREAPRTAEQEAKAREIYLRQNDARIAEVERRIREQDFAPKAKKEFPHDDLTTKSKVMLGKANERLQAAIKAKELADRSRFRRGMDATVHVLREIKLANLITSGEKLGGAALENVLTRPLSQLAAATTQIPRMAGITFLNDIRRKATYEGSLNQNAELKALRRMGSAEGLKAIWDKVRHGKSDLDWMHKDPHFTEEMTSYFGRVHGMIKEPVRQGIYSRSMKIRSDTAAKMGIDFKTDEIAANEASARAYEDANREIFMGDNMLTSGVRKMLNHWRNDKKNPGASKLMADAFEVLLPIINVPTNLAGRGMLLNPLVGFTKAAWGIMKAFNNGELKNGAEKLSEKDAEIIMRAYKYGMLGTAAALYAWNNPQHFGGIYTGISHTGGNEDKTLKAGDIHIPGTHAHINHHLAHGPLGTHLNVVADARREYDRILEKTGKKTDAALDAMAFLTMAPVRQLPYVQMMLRAADPIKSLGQNAGSLVRDSLYGTAFTNYYDTRNGKPVKRSPRDFKEELMMGIPGLRQQVPESKSQEKADGAAAASPFSGLPRPSRRPQTHRRPHR